MEARAQQNQTDPYVSFCTSMTLGEKIEHFGYNSLIYCNTNNAEAGLMLQQNLDRLVEWSWKWQMILHPAKCIEAIVIEKSRNSNGQSNVTLFPRPER